MSTRKLLMVIRVSLESLTGHKLRSFLTMLGVVIGVGAVIALVAVGQGAQAQVVSQFASLGSNMLTVQSGSEAQFSRGGLRQRVRALDSSDVDAIKGLATSVALVSPEYASNNATVTYQGKTTATGITGVTAEYAPVRSWAVSLGRFVTADDDANMASVAVLGQKTVETLFGSATANPIGETIRINRQSYEVIGVLKAKGQSGPNNQDAVVMIPLKTAQLKLGGAGTTSLRTIALQVRSAGEMDLAQAQVTAILRSLHGIQSGANDDFTVRNQSDIVATVEQTTSTFTTLLGSIAAISLLVGGIGIMNIMLVSVTERTREIGVRKAVGAKRGDILVQFLVEATVLSVLGGVIGVAAGVGGAQLISPLLGTSKALVTAQSVIMALAVSLGIGIFFGFYPANRAAGLNPIDALRYE
jgi:putative ABC transport system permease protein